MSLPDFLRRPDLDWSDFTADELRAIGELRRDYRRPPEDRDYAAVPALQPDASARLVKLTIDRVETYAALYWERRWAESVIFPSDEGE